MANSNTPFGFRPVGTISGSKWVGSVQKFPVDASNGTAIGIGSAVILEDDGNCGSAPAGGDILGVCVGVVVNNAVAGTVHPGYLPASTAGTILVSVGSDVLYEVQEDSAGGAMVAGNVGSNGDLVVGAVSTVTGVSAMTLDSSDVIAKDATPGSAQFRVWALSPKVGNEVGNYAKWLVRINENQTVTTTGL